MKLFENSVFKGSDNFKFSRMANKFINAISKIKCRVFELKDRVDLVLKKTFIKNFSIL